MQHVLTKESRLKIARWIRQAESMDGGKHIPSRAVKQFPDFFQNLPNVAFSRAENYFCERHKIVSEADKSMGRYDDMYATKNGQHGVCIRLTASQRQIRAGERNSLGG